MELFEVVSCGTVSLVPGFQGDVDHVTIHNLGVTSVIDITTSLSLILDSSRWIPPDIQMLSGLPRGTLATYKLHTYESLIILAVSGIGSYLSCSHPCPFLVLLGD